MSKSTDMYKKKTIMKCVGIIQQFNNKVKGVMYSMKSYVCDLCGYVYDPSVGDPDNGVEAGTAFEDLPEDWVCPLCGAGTDEFSEI